MKSFLKFLVGLACLGGGFSQSIAGSQSGSDVEFTWSGSLGVSGFTPSGDLTLTLGSAPPVGTQLMVIENTGLDFIVGEFDNLAHGDTVSLSFGGQNYEFVANYFGGTGNDLVLVWKAT